ncbi:protein CNPPD1 [Scaptodrosophila lebanonensis]|uniref:Protein CNPPD1 n=1 Tax=Drosophila lebanonensis TaxID=7225 RepID=A0A6J2TP95_DROLE|nr:protein CNPPD1 [Scaptodrosophila lebanonensis]
MGRTKYVTANSKKVMQHEDFIDRIRKTLYYGVGNEEDMEVSGPLAEYAAFSFSQAHYSFSLNRLSKITAGKMHATPCSLIMALIYLDRLNVIDPGYARRITPQELFVVSLMISTKFYAGHDERFYLEDWTKQGHMSEDRIKAMELEFLSAIDWNIYISNEQFFKKLSSVERTLAQQEGLRRGWLTYSELMQLLPSFTLAKFMLNNLLVLALSYAASVITIAGAFFIASQIPGTLWYRRPVSSSSSTTPTPLTTPVSTPVPTSNATQAAPIVSSDDGTISSIIISGNLASNESCQALNVEAELLKLEQQFCKEARLNELKRTRNEESMRYPSPAQNYHPAAQDQQDVVHHWLNIKSEYSDSTQNVLIFGQNSNWTPQNVSVIWQLLSDMMQNSFSMRWPELWPKLI